jgi:hypothetical protein
MRDEDVIGMVVAIVIFAVIAAVYIGLVVLGVTIAGARTGLLIGFGSHCIRWD